MWKIYGKGTEENCRMKKKYKNLKGDLFIFLLKFFYTFLQCHTVSWYQMWNVNFFEKKIKESEENKTKIFLDSTKKYFHISKNEKNLKKWSMYVSSKHTIFCFQDF